mmetsp:Transcript_23315/g.44503  ORF Transcript_23315/g.44503 Transcript_23315/m.44503 type:complete len:1563 (+) Transcript_23315:317-5005(+)
MSGLLEPMEERDALPHSLLGVDEPGSSLLGVELTPRAPLFASTSGHHGMERYGLMNYGTSSGHRYSYQAEQPGAEEEEDDVGVLEPDDGGPLDREEAMSRDVPAPLDSAGPLGLAVTRQKRQKRSRVVMVQGVPVLRANMYTLQQGERSVFDQELRDGAQEEEGEELNAALEPIRVVRRQRSTAPKKPRVVSTEQHERMAHNNELKAESEELAARRWRFLADHCDKLKPFVTEKVFAQLVQAKKRGQVLQPKPIPQPACIINGQMRDYQLRGLNWMIMMHYNGMNPILGDEMGLGKTCQTISFLSALKYELKVSGPHLVVVPLSVLNSWIAEFKRWSPTIRVVRLHSSDMNERERLRKTLLNDVHSFDVVLTTYEMVLSKNMKHTLHSSIHWRYVVLDEAHKCKNEESLISKAVKAINTQRILLLTGTPLQNNLHELWAILQLLYPAAFQHSSEAFDKAFNLTKSSVDKDMLNAAHHLLQPFMLRRIKSEVEVSMPPKVETKVMCPLSEQQLFWYKRLLLRDMALMSNVEGEVMGVDGRAVNMRKRSAEDWRRLRNLLMQLRKVCNHPYQLPGAEVDPDGTVLEDLVEASGKLRMLDRLLVKLKEAGHRTVLFSQFTHTLDLLDDYMRMKGYKFARLDGSTNRVQRMIDVGSFNRPGSDLFVYMLSTRAGGLGLNLQTADTCILFDSDWNPQVDLQAMARVHRIGQTKVVHIYRLVTTGSVEERVVQRAEKKLYLDKMVNWEGSASSNEWEDLSEGELLQTLKFGAQQIMQAQAQTMTDAQLDDHISALICRKPKDQQSQNATFTHDAPTAGGEASSSKPNTLQACEQTAASFEAELPAMDLRQLMGQDFSDMKHIKSNTSLQEIGKEWKQHEKRDRQSRTILVDGHTVLRQNNYDMETGELSVYQRELADAPGAEQAAPSQGKRRGGAQVAGRDYTHESMCLACQDGGDLLLCDLCPRAWHLECLEGTRCTDPDRPGKWQCPHHRCVECEKTAAAAGGLLFRCRACPNAYCEDHLPDLHIIIGKCPRLEPLGFRHPPQACYIHCNNNCAAKAMKWRELPSDQHAPIVMRNGMCTVNRATDQAPTLKRKRSKSRLETVILNHDYQLTWTDRSNNMVVLASASFSAMKDFLVRQLGSKFTLSSGQLLAKTAATSAGCHVGGEIFWELYLLARRLLRRPQDQAKLRPEGDQEMDLKKAARREELASMRRHEEMAQMQRDEQRRVDLEQLRQQRRDQRREAMGGFDPDLDWELLPANEEDKSDRAAEMRARLKHMAQGFLRLKGQQGATLIQMKAAKLFKGLVFRSKAQGLGVDLGDILEEMLDDNQVILTNPDHKANKRVHALSSFMAPEETWIVDTPLEWLKLAGRTDEEMEFMSNADIILRDQVMQNMRAKPTCSRAALYVAKAINDIIRKVTCLQRESGIPYALSILDNVLRHLVDTNQLEAHPPLLPAPPPKIEHSTVFTLVGYEGPEVGDTDADLLIGGSGSGRIENEEDTMANEEEEEEEDRPVDDSQCEGPYSEMDEGFMEREEAEEGDDPHGNRMRTAALGGGGHEGALDDDSSEY